MDCCRMATDRHPTAWLAIFAAALLALSLSGGCDDRSSTTLPPPDPTTAKSLPDDFQRPTTQQIVSAPRKTLELLTFPLTIDVPDLPHGSAKSPEWKISSTGGDSTTSLSVEGPGPSGDVMIQMSPVPGTHKISMIQGMEKSALKEKADHPDTVFFTEARSIGPVRIIERRTLQHIAARVVEMTNSKTQEVERRNVPASDSVEWSLTLFIPTGKDYTVGTLTFVGLTKEQYDSDKAFLEQLINSLHYEEVRAHCRREC